MTGSRGVVDTLLHLRPRSWPIVAAHFGAGAVCAGVLFSQSKPIHIAPVVAAAILWTVFLNGGTLALNSAFDKDTGDIGYLDDPPPVPAYLGQTGIGLVMAGAAISYYASQRFHFIPPSFTGCYFICALLSLLYSVPPVRLKAVPGADLVVNMIGYGFLTFLAGAAAVGVFETLEPQLRPLRTSTVTMAMSFGFLFAVFYPMTQIYQIESDAAAGDRTFAVMLGARGSLLFALTMLLLVLFLQMYAAVKANPGVVSVGIVVAVNLAWTALIVDWLRRHKTYPAQQGMYRGLKLWALSDIAAIAALSL